MKRSKQRSKPLNKNIAEVKISQILHHARLRKNYSLNDLYRITKIKPYYLKSIETGQFRQLPGGFYVRAFIKKYADAVDIDGNELLRRFNNKLPDSQDPQYMSRISEDKLLVNAEKERIRTRHSTIRKYIPLASLLIVIMMVLIGTWAIAAHYHNGLTTNFNEHSTSISGISSSESVHKRRHSKRRIRYRKRPSIRVRRRSLTNGRLKYQIKTNGQSVRLKLMNTQPGQLIIKVNHGTERQLALKAKQSKIIKLPSKVREIQISGNNVSSLRTKLNQKSLKLVHKQSIQSIIFKIIK